ncbi:MAG: enoyl-CoA hydratase-related protein [Actinomycetota bacterium]|nr:enoyl-CoA hydratase-related protein [Actinomycetota bacterium]
MDLTEQLAPVLGDAAGSLLVRTDAGVATVELHQPERHNAVSFAMWSGLAALMPVLARRDDVDLVVLRGSPGGPFSAGADISEFESRRRRPADAERYGEAVAAGEGALLAFPKPTLALVQGWAIGGGTQLALACDLRVCDASARFGITPAKLGIVYPLVSTGRLVDVVGQGWAAWMLLTGDLVDAEQALRIGLVHRVVPAGDLEDVVAGLAASLGERAQISLRGAKTLLARVAGGDRDDDASTRELYHASYASEEYAEGVTAFLAKRPPDFRGARDR